MTASYVPTEKLSDLRTELIDLAFVLETKGRVDAADLAVSISTRLGELCQSAPAAAENGGSYLDDSGGSVA